MDSTELHFINYDPEVLWNRIHDTYIDKGGDILYPGNEKEILLRAVEAIGVAIFAKVDNALRQATRKYSVREYLDLYGEEHDCPRIEAKAAKAAVRITFVPSGVALTIAAGTELTADGVVLHFRVIVTGEWSDVADEWAKKAIAEVQNVRSVLDNIIFNAGSTTMDLNIGFAVCGVEIEDTALMM